MVLNGLSLESAKEDCASVDAVRRLRVVKEAFSSWAIATTLSSEFKCSAPVSWANAISFNSCSHILRVVSLLFRSIAKNKDRSIDVKKKN
jgi:hypothetical protein